MTFPGFDHIYKVQNPLKRGAFVGTMDMSFHESAAVLAGESVPATPVRVTWEMGRNSPQDFVWTTSVTPLIASARVIEILRLQHAIGWDTYDVQLIGADDREVPGYKGLVVRGRCGPIRSERSVPVPKELPGGIFPAARGYFFDVNSWDGSDVFLVSGTGLVFVTQNVMQSLQNARVTGVRFVRADLAERLEL